LLPQLQWPLHWLTENYVLAELAVSQVLAFSRSDEKAIAAYRLVSRARPCTCCCLGIAKRRCKKTANEKDQGYYHHH
jgi:hypothetical protein